LAQSLGHPQCFQGPAAVDRADLPTRSHRHPGQKFQGHVKFLETMWNSESTISKQYTHE
jgi:hypothetical protein